jgi:hypothetical protein
MSTQTAQSIDFTHTYPQQGFRLLELSPELLELLSSDNPPTYVLIYVISIPDVPSLTQSQVINQDIIYKLGRLLINVIT